MLTQRQAKTLETIKGHVHLHGYAPTLEEIGQALGVRSKGAIHRLVNALVDKGYVIKERSCWRGLRLAGEVGGPTLPLAGRIAAGQPIEAIPGEDTLNLTDFLLGTDRYALRVQGDSMVGAGILDGDTVVVKQADTARDGEIVVALIDGEEATLKRLKRRGDGNIELVAENPAIAPMVYPASRVRIQGVVVAQMRSYR
ncbi:MAG TPA: transcriptional repressor LexA [Gammaproteobacteria bacterium]|nr:transcriptional repressor LexA [Gammaproteobacteria bacterium]